MDWLRSLWKIRFYALFAALTYGGFVWAGLSGLRLLGDDNEQEPNLNGTGGSHGSGGRATYFHK
ncbi:hypothetical protein [Hymenobacter metallilatus]|uniref:Uncharacterized protein n=1 Tax=Hymenobacter metallilatus TaxID=2493666 RepID=A0A3R9NG51_9BACT|nr:hypothetical protein [Hymenobacter metallilatus]RSK33828.1 hypothetical protein EI290_08950 [Hymenobacter metallilatus]